MTTPDIPALAKRIEELRTALRGGAEMLATMGNGEGWTIQSVIDHLESAAALGDEGDG